MTLEGTMFWSYWSSDLLARQKLLDFSQCLGCRDSMCFILRQANAFATSWGSTTNDQMSPTLRDGTLERHQLKMTMIV